ncbi:MAG TPA: cobalamin-independent methionine synthase II family protein [Thermomicrobiales bacterium]|nr:cobalamin-independent methionine synthase II family protein [Thermomicrobiales bacterium]
MRRSEERILTTHTGSLPRPDDLVALLYARDAGEPVDEAEFRARVRDAVAGIVRQQAAAGIAVVNDGEQGKVGYSTYVKERLTGFGDEEGRPLAPADLTDFPDYAARRGGTTFARPACTGPIAYRGLDAAQEEIADFRAALAGVDAADAFLTAASPGVISLFLENRHYPDHEAYLFALADAMKVEYDAIHQAGFVLQVDCPDLAMGRHIQFAGLSLADFRRNAELHVAALNRALADIPPDRLRMHLCWGNYEGPHHRDVALRDIIDIVFTARPSAISFEGANPRHEHEWAVFEDVKLPDGKILIPGVLDSTTNFIEHPELVAQRIVRFARLVGRENVIAGTDCGFATFAGRSAVAPSITWAKLAALAEGARLATAQLWA